MENLNIKYEQMVIEGDILFKQLETAELCLTAIIDYIFRYGKLINKPTVESILNAVYRIETDLRKKILYLRLEKVLVANDLMDAQG